MRNPLIPAVLGLKIGLLLCLVCGCDSAPTEPTPLEQAVAELRQQVADQKSQIDGLTAAKRVAEKQAAQAKQDAEIKDHSVLTPDQQREKFKADYPVVATLVFEPKSCPVPEVTKTAFDTLNKKVDELADIVGGLTAVKWTPKQKTAKAPPAQLKLTAALDDARQSHQKLMVYLTQNKCDACRLFEINVLDSPYFKQAIDGNYKLLTLNWDSDKETQEFTSGRTPNIVVYDPETDKWGHGFTPQPSATWMIEKLGLSLPADIPQPKLRRKIL